MKTNSELMGSLKWSIISFDSVVCQHFDIDTLKSLYELASTKVPRMVEGLTDCNGDRIEVCPCCKSEVLGSWHGKFCSICGQAVKYPNE